MIISSFKEVWKEFNCDTFGDNRDVYLTLDISLIADVDQNLRDTCPWAIDLDFAHMYTTPHFRGMQCSAKHKFISILSDVNAHMSAEQSIQGGITHCTCHNANLNKTYVNNTYQFNDEHSYLIYLDMNSLYDIGMIDFWPYGIFYWESSSAECTDTQKLLQYPED